MLSVTVGPDGRAKNVSILKDPGNGFGSLARSCAFRMRYSVGLDAQAIPADPHHAIDAEDNLLLFAEVVDAARTRGRHRRLIAAGPLRLRQGSAGYERETRADEKSCKLFHEFLRGGAELIASGRAKRSFF
jgi:hypothetical protein